MTVKQSKWFNELKSFMKLNVMDIIFEQNISWATTLEKITCKEYLVEINETGWTT